MNVRFGRFELDHAARILKLDGMTLAVQPRVFDVLSYLIANRARVVPKDELLDVVWSGVTVTEASLQRAISLARTILRKGDMGEALRSSTRVGYQFCGDVVSLSPTPDEHARQSKDQPQSSPSRLAATSAAMSSGNWLEASSLFQQADQDGILQADHLDRWALALECLGKPSLAIPILSRAVTQHELSGRDKDAARSALALARIHLERGEMAACAGWLARAEDMVRNQPDCREQGLLLWMKSRLAGEDGNPEQARDLADRAYQTGRRLRDAEVQSLGLIYRGFFKLCLGDTRDGLQDQDHAAAIGLSSKIDPVTGSTLYCNILWSCRTFGDWARAQQWTVGYQHWCTSLHMGYSGACQLHRAEVLGIQGSLQDALAHVGDALARLPADAPWAVGDAHRVLGDIHAMIGDDDAALDCYAKAVACGWDGEPGHAALLLERGEHEAAFAALERGLVGHSWWTLQRQGLLLAHLAIAAARCGRLQRARDIVDDLTGQQQRWPMASIRALANEAAAILAEREDRPEAAIRHLHLARQLWTSIQSRYHTARLRLRLAEMLLARGDEAGAATELRAAHATAEKLGVTRLRRRMAELEHSIKSAGRSTATPRMA